MASHSPCLRLLVFTTVLTFLAFTGNRVSFCSLSPPFFFPPVCVIVSALRSREVEKGELALCTRKEGILSFARVRQELGVWEGERERTGSCGA